MLLEFLEFITHVFLEFSRAQDPCCFFLLYHGGSFHQNRHAPPFITFTHSLLPYSILKFIFYLLSAGSCNHLTPSPTYSSITPKTKNLPCFPSLAETHHTHSPPYPSIPMTPYLCCLHSRPPPRYITLHHPYPSST